jgi:hypothetical protein
MSTANPVHLVLDILWLKKKFEILWDLHIVEPEQLSQYSNWAVG